MFLFPKSYKPSSSSPESVEISLTINGVEFDAKFVDFNAEFDAKFVDFAPNGLERGESSLGDGVFDGVFNVGEGVLNLESLNFGEGDRNFGEGDRYFGEGDRNLGDCNLGEADD